MAKKKTHGTDEEAIRQAIDAEDEDAMDACWQAIVKAANEFDAKAKETALATFNAGPVPGIMRSAYRARSHMLSNIELVERGKAPEGLADFNREDIVEMLHTQTYAMYRAKFIVNDKEPEEFSSYSDYLKYCLETQEFSPKTYETYLETEEYKSWLALFDDLRRYLHSAAALAKAIGSSAARLYLRAWKIMNDSLDGCEYSLVQTELTEAQAQTIMRLERVAAELLQIDLLYVELKPYEPPKKGECAGTSVKARA